MYWRHAQSYCNINFNSILSVQILKSIFQVNMDATVITFEFGTIARYPSLEKILKLMCAVLLKQ